MILKTEKSVACYKMISENISSRISRHFIFELTPSNSGIVVEKSRLRVLSFAYNSELDIFGILIQINKFPRRISYNNTGVVNIYHNGNGEFLRTVKLKNAKISHVRYYTLSINSYSIIVRESGDDWSQTVHVYMM